MIARELIDVQKKLKMLMTKEQSRVLTLFGDALFPYNTLTKNAHIIYENAIKETKKLWVLLFGICLFIIVHFIGCLIFKNSSESLCKIGQIQLLRQSISSILNVFFIFPKNLAYLPFELKLTFMYSRNDKHNTY